MFTQSIIRHIGWQDLKVKSEVNVVFEIAKKEGWEDCEIFGCGDMITQPQESLGWKLIPADQYTGRIPAEGVGRLHQIINAGIRVQGVIIADDERATKALPKSTKPRLGLSRVTATATKILSFIGRTLALLGGWLGRLGKMLVFLISIVGVIAFISVLAYWVISSAPIILIVGIAGMIMRGIAGATATAGEYEYDPKLVILVDDGNGVTTWVSLLTWYD